MKLKIISLLTVAFLFSLTSNADARYIAPKKKVRQQREEVILDEPAVFEGTSDYTQYPAAFATGQYVPRQPSGLRAIAAHLRTERIKRQHRIEERQRIRTGFY